jgi:hypothetical protein
MIPYFPAEKDDGSRRRMMGAGQQSCQIQGSIGDQALRR